MSITPSSFIAVFAFTLCVLSASNAQDTSKTSAQATLEAGRFQVSIPPQWRVVTGAELEQLKSEVGRGMEQMIERYRKDSGLEPRQLGIQNFAAAQLTGKAGWFVIHEIRIPPQKDYYEQMKDDTRQKIEWGMKQGIVEKVIENANPTISGNKVMSLILQNKGGGRTTTVAYWSAKQPSIVTQILVVQNNSASDVTTEVTNAISSLVIK